MYDGKNVLEHAHLLSGKDVRAKLLSRSKVKIRTTHKLLVNTF